MRVVIFANGDLPDPRAARETLVEDDLLVAADGGARHALALGRSPDVVIGDLDSLEQETLAGLREQGAAIQAHPRDKDETDLELALRYALARQPQAIRIVGALGDRLDHTLANLMLLTTPELAGVDVRVDDGLVQAFFCRDRAEVRGAAGDLLSLLPWGGPVSVASTQGLQWPVQDETLHPDRSRGISNRLLSDRAVIAVRSGTLLVVHSRRPVRP